MQRVVVEADQIKGQTVSLTLEQQHYLTRVLRLRAGDRFLVLNGRGMLWLATLLQAGKEALLSAPPKLYAEDDGLLDPTPHITLAACLPKQGFDEVIRQVTELGIHQVIPLISDRTLLSPSRHKLQRWRRIAAEAAEQSERLIVPTLGEPVSWSEWLSEGTVGYRCLCVERHTAPSLLTLCLSTAIEKIEIAIGPEGGWTKTEVEQGISAGYQPVTLGRGILRAVTASVVAISILQAGFEFANMRPYQVIRS